jgi:hypothetical protein
MLLAGGTHGLWQPSTMLITCTFTKVFSKVSVYEMSFFFFFQTDSLLQKKKTRERECNESLN